MKSEDSKKRKQNVKDTSKESYKLNAESGLSELEVKTVLKAFKELPEATIRMISVKTGIPISNIPHSRRKLTEAKIIEYVGKKPCQVTGRKAEYYRINSEQTG